MADTFFRRDGDFWICTICEGNGRIRKIKAFKKSTSGRNNHLKSIHKELICMKEEQLQMSNCFPQNPFGNEFLSPMDLIQNEFELATVEWIAVENQPIEVVESPFFKKMFSNTGLNLPSKKKLLNKLIPERAKQVTDEILSAVGTSPFSISHDVLSSKNKQLLGVTLHYLNEDFVRKDQVLVAADVSDENQAVENSSSKIASMVKVAGLDISHLVGIVSNGTLSATTSTKDFISSNEMPNVHSFVCTAHTINFIVTRAIRETTSIADLLNRIRSVGEYTNKSHLGRSAFFRHVENIGKNPINFTTDDISRWGSTYDMLRRFLYLAEDWNGYIVNFEGSPENLQQFTCSDLTTVQNISEVFEIARYWTKQVSGEISTLGDSYACEHLGPKMIENKMRKFDSVSAEAQFSEKLMKLWKQEFANQSEQNYAASKITCFLTPLYFNSQGFSDSFWAEFSKDCPNALKEMFGAAPNSEIVDFIKEEENDNYNWNPNDDLSFFLQPKRAKIDSKVRTLESEIKEYMKLAREDIEGCVFTSWNKYSTSLPQLSWYVRRLLSIPATSVSAKRLFSNVGCIYSNRGRNKLSLEMSEKLQLIRSRALSQNFQRRVKYLDFMRFSYSINTDFFNIPELLMSKNEEENEETK